MFSKYPRTPHLPWSEGFTPDDVFLSDISLLEGKEIIVTEKLDGENTNLYCDKYHARSIDSSSHPSQDYVRKIWADKKYLIPQGMRITGENMFAKHSIKYEKLTSYFYVFCITFNEMVLSIQDTLEYCELLDFHFVPILYKGIFNGKEIKNCYTGVSAFGNTQEGYVVRNVNEFPLSDFALNVSKFVRKNHVQKNDDHWKNKPIEKNIIVGL